MGRFAALGACATMGIALGCGGKSTPSSPGAEPNQLGPVSSTSVVVPCSAPSTPTVLHEGFPTSLAVVDGRALFIDQTLQSVPLAGGTPAKVVEGSGIWGLITTSDTTFFSATNANGALTPEGKQPTETALYSVPIAGGVATFVRDRFSLSVGTSDAKSVYLRDASGKVLAFTPPGIAPIEMALDGKLSISDLAVNGTDIFAAVQDLSNVPTLTGGIVKLPKGGGPARVIVKTAGLPQAIAADDSAVFWVEDPPVGTFGEGHVSRADLDGSNVVVLASRLAAAIAMDANYVYMLLDTLSRIPKAGGATEMLAGGFNGAGVLRISGDDAVWIDHYTKALSDPTPATLVAMCLHGSPSP